MRWTAMAALGLMACGSTSGMKGEKYTSAEGDAEAWWGSLFVEGTTMVFDVVAQHDDIDPQTADDPQPKWNKSTKTATLTCKVQNVATEGARRIADLACEGYEPELVYPPLMGTWVTDGTHLWTLGELAGPERAQKVQERLADVEGSFVSVPMKAQKLADDELETVISSQDGTTWCVADTMLVGDDGYTEVCFVAGRGIVRVRAAGGAAWSTVDTTYTRR